jgi:hypothetical protein
MDAFAFLNIKDRLFVNADKKDCGAIDSKIVISFE